MPAADPLPDPPPATLRLRIDGQALANNWRALDHLSGTAQTGAAVKADGYGLGIAKVMPPLLRAGAREFFVAHWQEVGAVLDHVAGKDIAVLHGVLNEAEASYARACGAVPVINSVAQARVWHNAGGGRCHLMVDTGINRLGIAATQLGDPAIAALEVDMLLSHLASADEDSSLNAQQLLRFGKVVATGRAQRYSLANSAGIALGREYAFDCTRPGLALYGGIPCPGLRAEISQVVFPQAAVLQVRDLPAGESVGYNATFTAPHDMRVATVALGYADGFLRSRGAAAMLRLDDCQLSVIGRVSMDMVVVDCGQCNIREGDMLTLDFDLERTASDCNLSQYELLTTLGRRFERL